MAFLPSDLNCFAWSKIRLGIGLLTGREARQRRAAEWVFKTFGQKSLHNIQERVKRLLEEAIELAQSEHLPEEEALALTKYVYSRPKGDPVQEAAGVGVCLLFYGWAKGVSVDILEEVELTRVEHISTEVFRQRHDKKIEAGISQPR